MWHVGLWSLPCLQITGKDKDFRYMATSDLLNELNKESFKADADLEVKLSNIVVQQLDDVAGDVSGLAVKWYTTCKSYIWFIFVTLMHCQAFRGKKKEEKTENVLLLFGHENL